MAIKLLNLCPNNHIMDHHHHNNRVPRIHAFSSSPTPPSPPIFSFIAALAAATLIFMCVYVLPAIVSAAFLLVLYISTLFVFRFLNRQGTIFNAQTPLNNQRVVKIFNKLFWVVEEKRGGHWHQVNKILLGSVVCFGSQVMASSPSSSSCSECAICLEDFKKGEECLVFNVCGHTFHCDCIEIWLQEKPNCPICRHHVPSSSATMLTKTRSMEFVENLV